MNNSQLDKTLLFLFPRGSHRKYTLQRARALFKVLVIVEEASHWSKDFADVFIPISLGLKPTKEAELILQALSQLQITIDGVFTPEEFSVETVGLISEKLNLVRNSSTAIKVSRDKFLLRKLMRELNLPSPDFYLINSEKDIPRAMQKMKFPAVLKLIDGASALASGVVNKAEDLSDCFNKTLETLKNSPELDYEWMEHSMSFCLEGFLDGAEVDVDVLLHHGECLYINIIDNEPAESPCLVQISWNCPTQLPTEHQKEMKEFVLKSLKELGYSTGVYHCEAKYTSFGPRMIEINCRHGGVFVPRVHKEVYNCDLRSSGLYLAVDEVPPLQVSTTPLMIIYGEFIYARKKGVLKDLKQIERMKEWENVTDAGIIERKFPCKVTALGYGSALSDQLAFIEVQGKDLETARALCREYVEKIHKLIDIQEN